MKLLICIYRGNRLSRFLLPTKSKKKFYTLCGYFLGTIVGFYYVYFCVFGFVTFSKMLIGLITSLHYIIENFDTRSLWLNQILSGVR